MNKGLYSQLQLQADVEPVQITQSEQNAEDDEVNGERRDQDDNNSAEKSKSSDQSPFKQQKLEQILYSGAFAYTSPPERVMLSDNVYQYGSFGENCGAAKYQQESTPFNSKFTVLKFNSDSQNQNKVSRSPKKMNSLKKAKVNVFKLY